MVDNKEDQRWTLLCCFTGGSSTGSMIPVIEGGLRCVGPTRPHTNENPKVYILIGSSKMA